MNELFKNNITLDQENHKYILKENPDFEFTSVTEFIHKFFKKFDKDKVAKKQLKNNPKYFGKTIEDVIEDWNKGSQRGNIVHNELEDYINEKIKQPTHYMSKIGAAWIDYKKSKGNKFNSEVIVYSKQLQIAGTIDVLLYNEKQNAYHIVDWKTNKRINETAFNKQKGIKDSTKHLPDCNYIHYSLQLSFYKRILESYYGIDVGSLTIIHFKEDAKNQMNSNKFLQNVHYKIYSITDMSSDIDSMLREMDLV